MSLYKKVYVAVMENADVSVTDMASKFCVKRQRIYNVLLSRKQTIGDLREISRKQKPRFKNNTQLYAVKKTGCRYYIAANFSECGAKTDRQYCDEHMAFTAPVGRNIVNVPKLKGIPRI